jgi:preprotein translocase subunit SecA
MGGAALHEGDIAEMKTGEGKTLVAVMPMYLNALEGRGAHLVTVNDYLARRDSEWMGPIYEFLGLEVGLIQSMMDPAARQVAYGADLTYGTNAEFGFDYLRDNMAMRLDHCVQRGHNYCIVDEVDSSSSTRRARRSSSAVPRDRGRHLPPVRPRRPAPGSRGGFRGRREAAHRCGHRGGVAKVERALDIDNLYKDSNGGLVNHFIQALRAQALYQKDVEYVVQNGEVLIVDEFTGRILEGRRYSEGLHQAIEAKEKVPIREENQTLATITLQNYFRMYDVLAGMTGTAKTEEDEFRQIYQLEVVQIPTNAPMVRLDENDYIFTTEKEKYAAVVDDVVQRYEKGQPVLVGTVSVEVSEMLSRLLERHGVEHHVLNAKQHEREAHIIENAGQKGAITIATNMAGRGVDIKLGEGVIEAGGLYVLGTERHEPPHRQPAAAAQGARATPARPLPSAEDDLIRLFSGDRMYCLTPLGPQRADRAAQDAHRASRRRRRRRSKSSTSCAARTCSVRRVTERAAARHLRPAPAHPQGEDFGEQVRR